MRRSSSWSLLGQQRFGSEMRPPRVNAGAWSFWALHFSTVIGRRGAQALMVEAQVNLMFRQVSREILSTLMSTRIKARGGCDRRAAKWERLGFEFRGYGIVKRS